MEMSKRKVAVIGGGAAGIVAAIEAADNGAEVTIFERNDRIGKKILATGNGKCNLSNMKMDSSCFHTMDKEKLKACLENFGVEDTLKFFEKLGLMIKNKNDYLYPASEQAAVVLDVLRIGVLKRNIRVKTECKVTEIRSIQKAGNNTKRGSECFAVSFDKEKEYFDKVIIASGSKAAPKTGSDGSGYELAKNLGHNIISVVPSLVQLKCSDVFCKSLAGIRAEACVHICEDGQEICREAGEVQLTDYGISGIPVFQLSARVNRKLLDKKHGVITAVIDFMPGMTEESFSAFRNSRMKQMDIVTVEEFFTGMLNKKLMMLFIKHAGLNPAANAASVPKKQLEKVFEFCRGLVFHIIGNNGFENAQVCAGGVDLREVTQDLESKKVLGLFFAGEILDVDGRCGGYNLQWAWTSGVIAGRGVCK